LGTRISNCCKYNYEERPSSLGCDLVRLHIHVKHRGHASEDFVDKNKRQGVLEVSELPYFFRQIQLSKERTHSFRSEGRKNVSDALNVVDTPVNRINGTKTLF